MLIGEPQRTGGDLYFSLFGFPVRVHPFFWLAALLLGARSSDAMELVLWVVAMFLGILIHELGHAAVVRGYGAFPEITLYALGGLTSYQPSEIYRRGPGSPAWRQIVISAAGPAAGFAMAAVLAGILVLAGQRVIIEIGAPFGLMAGTPSVLGRRLLTEFVNDLFFVSIAWGILNLLPIYPLDGGQIARELFLKVSPRDGIRQSLILSMLTAGTIAVLAAFAGPRPAWFAVFMFGYLAYSSYAMLQAYLGRGPW